MLLDTSNLYGKPKYDLFSLEEFVLESKFFYSENIFETDFFTKHRFIFISISKGSITTY